jgi:hypothetical protein
VSDEKKTTLGDFTPDPNNLRRHTPRNVGMIQDSIHKSGFGRPMVASGDGVLLAGNATAEAAAAAGMGEDVIVIESDGTKPIVVVRTDLKYDSKEARSLAIADNRTAELSEWDVERFAEVAESDPDALQSFWFPDEISDLIDFGDEEFEPSPAPSSEPFAPTLNPSASYTAVTEEDIERTGDRLDNRYAGSPDNLTALLCPHCGETFYLKELPT